MMINVLEYLEHTLDKIADPNKIAFFGSDSGIRPYTQATASIGEAVADKDEAVADKDEAVADKSALSFNTLSILSRSCGSYISSRSINKKPIAVFMQKSPAMIAAFLGVVYSGSYYIPIDAEMPAFRIRLILEAVDPPLIICDDLTSSLIANWGLAKNIDTKRSNCSDQSYETVKFDDICTFPVDDKALLKIRKSAIDADPLYVVFTSGSTGTPKGVVATHRSVIDYIENLSAVLDVTTETIFGNQSPLYLDACLKEIYTTLKFGSSAYLIPQSLFMFPVKLIEYLNDNKINTICWVASALSLIAGLGALKSAVPKTLHTIAFGSEVFPIRHYNLWRETLPDARFIHLYGPTEATGMSCFYEATKTYDLESSIPIGHPFPNTEIILLDDNMLVPQDGQPGEICIRGTCLSPGYFGDMEKTAAAFIQNPLSAFPDIIYKTGDLGRRGPDGELYYISRRDHQIKHMGHRIELAEIEWVANGCEKVGLSCAVFDDTTSRIILYYVTADTAADGTAADGTAADGTATPGTAAPGTATPGNTKSTVRSYLKTNLPRYMMPHSIFQLEELPRTPGGKLDRVGLLKKYTNEKENK